jgi:chemotaxis-related protein WspB
MLFLLFRLGEDSYVLEASRISQVLPLVRIKPLAGAPAGVAGIINHRGLPVPVIDLSELLLGRPALRQLSTRIVLFRDLVADGRQRPLGVIVEQATETLRRDAADFVSPGLGSGAPYLGPVLTDPGGLIQWVDPARLLPDAVSKMLLQERAGSA